MPRPSSLACACATAAPASPPAAEPKSPPPATKRRGNPNLALIPRCGARTRAGCPCRAPAMANGRCRMHGGRSTGPRTPEGRARIAAARTIHGLDGADARAFKRHHVTFMRRGSVRMAAVLHRDRLPPDLAARMMPIAPELLWPPRPTCGITRAEDRALLQAETAALAPWKLAIAQARQARRAARAGPAAPRGGLTAPHAGSPAPEPLADAAATASPAVPPAARAEPHAPIRPAPARVARHQAPGKPGAPAVAKPLAPEQAAAAPAAPASARAEPLAPIPPSPGRDARDQAPASVRADPAAKPLATERPGSAPAPARLAAPPIPHAPEHAATTHRGSRAIPIGRAARRWLRRQKLMQRNRQAGPQP